MTAKLLETIISHKFSSNWNNRVFRQQRNGHLEALKWLEITNRQFCLHKYMNWSSEFHSTKANLHSLGRVDSSSSFCISFSSNSEDWEFASWLGFSVILSLQTSQKSLQWRWKRLDSAWILLPASEKTARTVECGFQFSDWLASLLSRFWLVYCSGLKYILAGWIPHFSPQNTPQCSMKLL